MGVSRFLGSLLTGEPLSQNQMADTAAAISFDDAIAAHLAWKHDVTNALEREDSERRFAHQAGDDGACILGRWISGVGYKRYGHLASFAEVRNHHSRFHRLAREVVELHRSGETGRAQQLATGEFEEASRNIVVGLRRFSGDSASGGNENAA